MKTLFGPDSGAKTYSPGSSTNVTTSAFSQPHVLRRKMEEERLTHAETVTANISPVRLESYPGKMVLYFCPMKTIEIIEKVAAGDGGNLPSQVSVEGLVVPGHCQSGLYSLKNVILTSNGTMQVLATAKTEWEKLPADLAK